MTTSDIINEIPTGEGRERIDLSQFSGNNSDMTLAAITQQMGLTSSDSIKGTIDDVLRAIRIWNRVLS